MIAQQEKRLNGGDTRVIKFDFEQDFALLREEFWYRLGKCNQRLVVAALGRCSDCASFLVSFLAFCNMKGIPYIAAMRDGELYSVWVSGF